MDRASVSRVTYTSGPLAGRYPDHGSYVMTAEDKKTLKKWKSVPNRLVMPDYRYLGDVLKQSSRIIALKSTGARNIDALPKHIGSYHVPVRVDFHNNVDSAQSVVLDQILSTRPSLVEFSMDAQKNRHVLKRTKFSPAKALYAINRFCDELELMKQEDRKFQKVQVSIVLKSCELKEKHLEEVSKLKQHDAVVSVELQRCSISDVDKERFDSVVQGFKCPEGMRYEHTAPWILI